MRPGMSSELRRIAAVTCFCLVLGVSMEAPLEIMLLGFAGYLFWSLRMVSALFAWVDRGMRGSPPTTDGIWGEISDTLNRQKRRHRRAKEKMRHTINRTTRMTEALDEGMLVLKSDLSLDWWNNAAEGLVGLRVSDRGSAIFNLVRDPKFVEYMTVAEFAEPIQLPSSIYAERLLEFSGSHFGHGEIVLIVTDITRLDSLEQLRKEFVANVSHELRTPLTVIKGYIETLREISTPAPSTDRAFDNISAQANKMQALADDLILLSKLESEAQPKTLEHFDLRPLLDEIIVDAEQLSGAKHQFNLDCDEGLRMQARPKDMRSAMGNIVFNAVRHNPAGARIWIHASEDDESWHIAIRDDGVGIDPSEIPRITERFYRVDSSRNSHSGGTGLGLAIVKHTLNIYGGSLVINSRGGEGAEFICRVPKA